MPVCVVVLAESQAANQLTKKLVEAAIPVVNCKLIKPPSNGSVLKAPNQEDLDTEKNNNEINLEPVGIDTVKLLNPKLSRKERQRNMALWLMPFGFLAGLTFTQMTGLQTFSNIGLGQYGEPLIGSLLGMGSGLLGSYVATASVNPAINDDIRVLRNRNQDGQWLLLLETPLETELPWQLVREVNPIDIVSVRDL